MSEAALQSDWSAWPAPAKLNLFLHITGRRADGYHDLQTVFQLLDWGDTLHCRVRADGAIRRLGEHAHGSESDDLIVRAAKLLQSASGSTLGADLRIDKRIPVGGGMGGGSSDAASTLVALNRLWNCGLDLAALAGLGLQLGADVPVFIHGRSAFAEGVGDRLVPIDLALRNYVVVDPGVGISTAALFQAPELTRDSAPLTIAGFICGAKTENVFEPAVRARYAAVARALDWLSAFGDARLSGTGGVVFVPAGMHDAEAIVAACPAAMRAWIVRGINVSPLLALHRDGVE
ncbi:MAG: 4-(cytidine 5'-diphospho)-2-C-methyl-D-erythritol kinase [Dokdonella sp.]|nr:4-(cytidine 5'-diphospho)-2-C-methyl-D-erythritol kinase [Dokdonella sp.]HQW75687.1 4-(cytidine 5'-diphospho)-2-C-methyl-D-erythritol kinase [Dokdonella sp.]HQX65886.1 4-(cytidine 5'-diphospho)-2-C-methyl-D-erythritol kinase [Dokdonella sp.]HQY53924.1 4-(cytidine 5'-diphospho)-2-C-methyl-D-erythritol kinase [Dokdonella sp.]HQZ61150.1 4-(cytidine 5'-diphospho)-2-C-methyl-D-erythritol kinase [Dokdonella sp.]